jgi:hypothetical protein
MTTRFALAVAAAAPAAVAARAFDKAWWRWLAPDADGAPA